MSEGGGSESDDSMNSRANRDWEMVSLTSSTCAENGSNGVCTEIMEGLDSDTFIFPPSRHEGLPIESEDHYGIESPLLGSENLNENISEHEEEAPLVGPEFEPPRAEEENSGNFDELRDSGVSGEGNRVSEAEENVELKHESFAALKPTIFHSTIARLNPVRITSARTPQNGPHLLTHTKNSFLGDTTHYLKSLTASQILSPSPVPISALIKRLKERPLDKVIESQKKLKLVNQIKHILLKQPNQKMSVAELAKHRKHLGLQRGRRLIPILRRYPSVFQVSEEEAYCFYFTLTPQAQQLHREELQIKSQMEGLLVENLRKLLMMSVSKRVLLEKIAHLATDMGLPMDFRTNLCNKYPEFFKVVDTDYGPALELTSWDPTLAVSFAEKASEEANIPDSELILDRPRKFKKLNLPNGYSLSRKDKQRILMFQEMPFISPYSDCTSLQPASMEAEKHACAVIHELLSLTVEKRTLVDILTHFRHAFKFSNKVRAMLLRHPELFYVSFKGDRDSVFLREAYRGSELKEKGPFLLWKEKLQALMLAGKRQTAERRDGDGESMDEDDVAEGSLSDGMFEVEDASDFDNFDCDEWSDLEDGEIGLAPKPAFPGQAELLKSPVERKLATASCDAGSREHW